MQTRTPAGARAALDSATALPLMDIREVETTFGISERMLRRLVAERRLSFVKVGRLVRFRPEVIAAWLDTNTVEAVHGTRAR